MTASDTTGSAPHAAAASQLGKSTAYTGRYDPSLLFPIDRAEMRAAIGLAQPLPFFGADLWTSYELSWLGPRGRPQVTIAHFTIPCESACIVESKSFKLYLNSFGETAFASPDAVRDCLRADVSQAISRGAVTPVSAGVRLVGPDAFEREAVRELEGLSLDRMDVDCDEYSPAPHFLQSVRGEQPVTEVLTSNLLKTNCPVTGQPDWGSVQIGYSGPQIDQGGLLRYLVSFRQHQDFHEHCVERMFNDIWTRCAPTRLWVYARYTRRGGLDINPFRTSHPRALPALHRTARQ